MRPAIFPNIALLLKEQHGRFASVVSSILGRGSIPSARRDITFHRRLIEIGIVVHYQATVQVDEVLLDFPAPRRIWC